MIHRSEALRKTAATAGSGTTTTTTATASPTTTHHYDKQLPPAKCKAIVESTTYRLEAAEIAATV